MVLLSAVHVPDPSGPTLYSSEVEPSGCKDDLLMVMLVADRVDSFDPVQEGRDQVCTVHVAC